MHTVINFIMKYQQQTQLCLFVGLLFIAWNIENTVGVTKKYKKWHHALKNSTFIFSNMPIQILLGYFFVKTIEWTTAQHFGILHLFKNNNLAFQFIASFILLDFGEYVYHIIMHKVKMLWIFHVIHHSDNVVDISTTLREHPMETLARLSFTLLWVFLSGTLFWALIVRQTIQIFTTLFAHINYRLPQKIDNIVGLVFITPNLHHVHHHYKQPYTDCNYGDVLSIWDRLFGTFKKLPNINIEYGIDTFENKNKSNSSISLLAHPFQKKHSTSILNVLLFLSLFTFISCEKVITISSPPYSSKPSIQCMIEPDSLPKVYFNQTVPYFDKKVSFQDLVIRNAQIKIQSTISTDSLYLDSVYNRIYCQYDYFYKGNTPIIGNVSYTLNIKSGEDVFIANTTTDQLPCSIDSVSFTATFSDLYGDHEGVITYFKDVPLQENYYRYEMVRYVDTSTKLASQKIVSPCIGTDSVRVNEIGRSVYADVGLQGQQIKIVVEPAYSHKQGTKALVYITSIDKNAYNFFDQLDKQKLAQFNPFVEPIFLKDGQFGTKAIGYFSAMRKSNPVIFIYPE